MPMATKKKATHGGHRRGAGRPPILDEAVKLSLTLERATLDGLAMFAASQNLPVGVYVRGVLAQHVARRQQRADGASRRAMGRR